MDRILPLSIIVFIPFMDKEETTVGMLASINRDIIYNTSLVKKGEIYLERSLLSNDI